MTPGILAVFFSLSSRNGRLDSLTTAHCPCVLRDGESSQTIFALDNRDCCSQNDVNLLENSESLHSLTLNQKNFLLPLAFAFAFAFAFARDPRLQYGEIRVRKLNKAGAVCRRHHEPDAYTWFICELINPSFPLLVVVITVRCLTCAKVIKRSPS